MIEANLKKLYDNVSAKFDIGDYDTFKKKMQTREGRKRFFDKVSEKYNIGTFEAMEIKLMGTGCLSKIAKNKVEGKPGVYKLGNTTYKFYNSGSYRTWAESGEGPKGTWACNSKGFIELNGKESSLGGSQTQQWVISPTEEEVKSGKKVVKVGMKGDFVKKLQNELNIAAEQDGNTNYNVGKVDGFFGKKTQNGLRNFQTSAGLNPDGVLGQKTYNVLFREKQTTSDLANKEIQNVDVQTPETGVQKASPIQSVSDEVQKESNMETKSTIKESLKKNLNEKRHEKENLLIESQIINKRLGILSEGITLETEEDKINLVENISQELNYLSQQGYSSKLINEGLFSFLGSLFGGSVKSVPAVFGEYIAQWLTKKLGVPEGSYLQAAIVALVGNLNVADYDKLFTDCRFASNKIADSLIEAYLIQMQQRSQATSQGATGFITSAMRNAISDYLLEDKDGIVQKLQDMIGDFICPKLSKVASTLTDKADEIKDKAMA